LTQGFGRRFLALLIMTAVCPLVAQSPPPAPPPTLENDIYGSLPAPTGDFRVGRVTVHWIDTSRIEPLSQDHDYRDLMVDIWYPAEPSTGTVAPYLDTLIFEKVLGTTGFRDQFRDASDAILKGVKTHAIIGASFAGSGRGKARPSPILIFSPGGGMVREVYTAQMEGLASHGYIVAAISHPYDAIVTVLPDGRFIQYDSKRWPAIPSLEGIVNLNQLEWHTEDIKFVIDQLIAAHETASSALPFAQYIDPLRIGAFGHSFGGMAAAHACQLDPRLKACLDEDGVAAKRPFYSDSRGWRIDQAFMLIERAAPTAPPSDRELAKMRVTRQKAEGLLRTLASDHVAALQNTGRGGYDIVLTNKNTSHMDFSDLSVLGAHDATELQAKKAFLSVVEAYTRAFFDEKLSGIPEPLIDSAAASGLVLSAERYQSVTAPCRK
jgi:hypothetical protein